MLSGRAACDTREIVRLFDALLGKPLPTRDAETERVGVLRGIPLFGLDALSSAAYGPEALLTVLLPLGAAGLRYVLPLTLAIVALLTALFVSYRQTIEAYPSGGGSYTVARENLGRKPSLIAAAALVVDYLLNVAVAISAGVGAIVSAVPALLGSTLPMCLAVLLVLVLVNLRGVRASGGAFALPTYAFVTVLLGIIGLGLAQAARGQSEILAAPLPRAGETATAWVLLRAFANGCTAMTGVEAVSNGVPNFREPSTVHARRTLGAVVALLILFLVGVALLCRADHVFATPPGASGYESILSQLAHRVFGHGILYQVSMAAIFAVLALSANTSFADFPRVARLLAEDRFLPEVFEHRGRRLVFSIGILVLAALSGLVLIVFRGVTDRLIPLFAVGALTAFTLSQAGMVVHWHRRNVRGGRMWANAVGATMTAVAVVLVIVSKFLEGAWLSVLAVLGFVMLFSAVRRHYEFMDRATKPMASLEIGPTRPALAVVPVRRWNAVALKALRFAAGFAPEVIVVQVMTGTRDEEDLTPRWREIAIAPAERIGIRPPELVVLRSEYRQLFSPLLQFVKDLADAHRDRQVAVVVPELVEQRWYYAFLHSHASSVLKALLLLHGGPQIVVITMPWYLREWIPERRSVVQRMRELARTAAHRT